MKDDLTPPLKWHGGKHDLAKWIIGLMPPRCKTPNAPKPDDPGWLHYVEPYFGGGAVLLANDPEGVSEVVNDLNDNLANFWMVLQEPVFFPMFQRVMESTPFSEFEYQRAVARIVHFDIDGPVTRAVAFFIACRQSLSGRMKGFTGITRQRTRRGMNAEVSAWLNCIEGLPAVHERLKRVLIRNRPALEIIQKEDGPRTLFYLDPPYLHETRATTGEYLHEMTEVDHIELLTALNGIKGRFLLSGYHSTLYDEWAFQSNFTCHEMQINNHAASGKTKRTMTECVWTNF
jgi:DNA adenine methylase